jgi:short subunit dehydrogenase-like uncharacterized protein
MTNIVLFGATGYTGTLTAHALMRRGITPTLAGRSVDRLSVLAQELQDSYGRVGPIAIADSQQPASVRELVSAPSDVLVTTVGPFTAHGSAALNAAIKAGSAYVDSTGEPPFVRHVFTAADAPAKRTGARLLTAFGYDYVPGNFAGLVALRRAQAAGAIVDRIEIGYFIVGGFGISSGTKASAAAMLLEPSFAYRDGHLTSEATAAHVSQFTIEGRPFDALSIGGSEHFCLPALDSNLRRVDVYLGWAGRHTRNAQRGSRVLNVMGAIPGASTLLREITKRIAPTGSGPSAEERRGAQTVAIARTFDARGEQVSYTMVRGPSPYDLTAELLAWSAEQFQQGHHRNTGALGPVPAFGEDVFVRGCTDLQLEVIV